MNKNYKDDLLRFKEHLNDTLDEIMQCDGIADCLESIEITINKKTFKLELGADIFALLEEMVDFELNEN